MPFKSDAQRRFLFAKKPNVARQFVLDTPKGPSGPSGVGYGPRGPQGPKGPSGPSVNVWGNMLNGSLTNSKK